MATKYATSLDLPALFTKSGYEALPLTPNVARELRSEIQKGIRKGQDEDAAFKAALKEVGLHPRLLRPEQITVADIPGGHYTSIDNGDGTWNILDVPVVGEIRQGEKNAPFDVGAEWHKAALRKALTRQGDGHWGAVHVNHHGELAKTEEAGMIRFRRVGTVMYQGEPMSAMYADLLRVPEDKFQLIDQGRLRYMSVEIASWEEPEVASLAIMPDETPFFRLPMLTTGKKIKADAAVKTTLQNSPAVGYALAGPGGFILFNLGGPVKKSKKPAAPIATLSAKELAKKEELETLTSLKEYVVAKLEDGGDMDAGGDDGDGGDFMLKLFKFAKAQLSKMGVKFDDSDSDSDDGSDFDDGGDSSGDDGDGGDLSDGSGAYGRNKSTTGGNEGPGQFGRPPVEQGDDKMNAKDAAKLSARIDGLEKDNAKLKADNDKRATEEKIKTIVAKAHEDLRGYFLSADTKAKIQKFAEKDLSGETVTDFVATYKSVASPDETGAEVPSRTAAPRADEPEALAKLAAKGPEEVARGREIYAEYLRAKQSNHVPQSMTFERYLDINLSLPALKVRK